MGIEMLKIVIAVLSSSIAVPAVAEPLRTYWTLEPSAGANDYTVKYGERFFVQRLLPVRLAILKNDYEQSWPADTILYAAYTRDDRTVYCTFKNRSLNHQVATLFLPIFDTRPCFLDRDLDGRFDATFSVFDKYGSMATPSGDVERATPLAQKLTYTSVDPHLAPETMRIAFEIAGSQQPSKARVNVAFDRVGRDRWEYLIGKMPREGASITVLNAQITIASVVDKRATVSVVTAPDVIVSGDSGGTLMVTQLPMSLR